MTVLSAIRGWKSLSRRSVSAFALIRSTNLSPKTGPVSSLICFLVSCERLLCLLIVSFALLHYHIIALPTSQQSFSSLFFPGVLNAQAPSSTFGCSAPFHT